MTEIFDIRQLGDNRWQAKYHGNYGVYTIKLRLNDDGKAGDSSCTCPSHGYPCKHIGFVRSAVLNHIKAKAAAPATDSGLGDLLRNVSLDELRAFVLNRAAYDKDLSNDLALKFAGNVCKDKELEDEDEDKDKDKDKNEDKDNNEDENPYSLIIGEALSEIEFDIHEYNEGYRYYGNDEYYVDMSILCDWLKKAEDFVSQGKREEAIMICKACVEEYAQWLIDNDDDEYSPEDFICDDYMSGFFALLEKVADSADLTSVDKKSLYEYCLTELNTKKHARSGLVDDFYDLMSRLAVDVDSDEFVALQNILLKKIEDKSSRGAEKILERIIRVYRASNRPEKATETMENNMQVESYRRQVTERFVSERNYAEAKLLINEFLAKTNGNWNKSSWKELLLDIAQRENDADGIRKIALEFLTDRFTDRHFEIYKRAFGTDEWTRVFEELYRLYDRNNSLNRHGCNENLTELLRAENLPERLMALVESNPSKEAVEKYCAFLSATHPERILELFRRVVDKYAEGNLGRNHYEYVKKMLEKMLEIQGGNAVVVEMVLRYRTKYRQRRAMIEILSGMNLK